MFIIDAIKKIKNSKRILFTTPSHLNGGIIPFSVKNLIGKKAFYSDLSEVEGLDNMKNPKSCLKKSQEWATKLYDTKQTFYLINGSSSGILALMLATLKENDKVILSRNIHESIINGLVLTGAVPVWLIPEYDKSFNVAKGITVSQVAELYNQNKDVKAVLITSPTYEGMCSEVKEIAEFCKRNNLLFFVDEAHGALFPFSDKLPDSVVSLGVDACVQSLHKTTPALTGTALLHICKNSSINVDDIQRSLNIINTTSPSWLLISSVEGAIEYMHTKSCQKEIEQLIMNVKTLIEDNKNFEFLTAENHDVTKLVFAKKGYTGEQLSEFLFENNIEDELASEKSVLCLCGIGTSGKKLKKLSRVLKKIKNNNTVNSKQEQYSYSLPMMKMSPKDAYNAEWEYVSVKAAVGKIAAENITPYPPCVPVLIAGEVIEQNHMKYIEKDRIKVIKN